MTSTYVDADGNPCSREQMVEAIYKLALDENFTNFIALHQRLIEVDSKKHMVDSSQLQQLATRAGLTAIETSHLLEQTQIVQPSRFQGLDSENISAVLHAYDKKKLYTAEQLLELSVEALTVSNYDWEVLESVLGLRTLNYEMKYSLVKNTKVGDFPLYKAYASLAFYHAEQLCANEESKRELQNAYVDCVGESRRRLSSERTDSLDVKYIIQALFRYARTVEDLDFLVDNIDFEFKHFIPPQELVEDYRLSKKQTLRLFERLLAAGNSHYYYSMRESLKHKLQASDIENLDRMLKIQNSDFYSFLIPGDPDKKLVKAIKKFHDKESYYESWERNLRLIPLLVKLNSYSSSYKILERRTLYLRKYPNSYNPSKVSLENEKAWESLLPDGKEHDVRFYEDLLERTQHHIRSQEDYQHLLRQLTGVEF